MKTVGIYLLRICTQFQVIYRLLLKPIWTPLKPVATRSRTPAHSTVSSSQEETLYDLRSHHEHAQRF